MINSEFLLTNIDIKTIDGVDYMPFHIVKELIRTLHQVTNPQLYDSSKTLSLIDYLDIAHYKCTQLNLDPKQILYDDPNFLFEKEITG